MVVVAAAAAEDAAAVFVPKLRPGGSWRHRPLSVVQGLVDTAAEVGVLGAAVATTACNHSVAAAGAAFVVVVVAARATNGEHAHLHAVVAGGHAPQR